LQKVKGVGIFTQSSLKMKSFLLSLLSCVAIAYTGAFFEVWQLPRHENILTARDVGRKLKPFFKFTDDVREIRDDMREKNEKVFITTP
jgi:hypothetical protein